MRFDRSGLSLDIQEEIDGTRLRAGFRDGETAVTADVLVERPAAHETMNVVIPWSETRFQFTSKQVCRPARGAVEVNGDVRAFGAQNHAFGCLDYGRGIWPYNTVWNWAAASGVQGPRCVGITLGGQWTDGTGMTENALCVDGRVHKLSEDLLFSYDRSDWMKPWRIRTPRSSRVDLTLTPFHERRSAVNAVILASEVHALFGHFAGTIVTDDGEHLAIENLMGWAEEHRARW